MFLCGVPAHPVTPKIKLSEVLMSLDIQTQAQHVPVASEGPGGFCLSTVASTVSLQCPVCWVQLSPAVMRPPQPLGPRGCRSISAQTQAGTAPRVHAQVALSRASKHETKSDSVPRPGVPQQPLAWVQESGKEGEGERVE